MVRGWERGVALYPQGMSTPMSKIETKPVVYFAAVVIVIVTLEFNLVNMPLLTFLSRALDGMILVRANA